MEVGEGLYTEEQKAYVDGVPDVALRSHLLHQVRLRDIASADRDYFEKEARSNSAACEYMKEQIAYLKAMVDAAERVMHVSVTVSQRDQLREMYLDIKGKYEARFPSTQQIIDLLFPVQTDEEMDKIIKDHVKRIEL